MRTPLIVISLFLSGLLNAQTTGKILVLSNVTGQVLVDSVADVQELVLRACPSPGCACATLLVRQLWAPAKS